MSWFTKLIRHLPRWITRTLSLVAVVVAVCFYAFALVFATMAVITSFTGVGALIFSLAAAFSQVIAMLSQKLATDVDTIIGAAEMPTSYLYALPVAVATMVWSPTSGYAEDVENRVDTQVATQLLAAEQRIGESASSNWVDVTVYSESQNKRVSLDSANVSTKNSTVARTGDRNAAVLMVVGVLGVIIAYANAKGD